MRGRSICIVSVASMLAVGAHAAELNVPLEYPSIQDAIDAANPGDTVLVAAGVYTGAGNRDITFNGKAITVRSVNGAALCIIDCQGTPEVPYRGFAFTSGEGRDSVLQGFTVRNGATLPGAIADQFNGAGIMLNQGSSPTIRDMVITGSWAGCWGGAICCSDQSHPLIERCTIVGNRSDDDGGGIFAWAGSNPTIIDTIIANNTTTVAGGGLFTFSGQLQVINSTIVGNTALFGAGVWANAGTTFVNSIVWGNEGQDAVGGNPTITYSLVAGGFAGEGNVDTVPNFVDATGGDYRLAANSPLIDVGDPTYEPAKGETDADGNLRIVGTRIDIGAYEFQGTPCRADFNGDGTIGFADLVGLLSNWGSCDGCPEDLDGSGTVDFGDLVAMLAQWGRCP